MSYSNQIDNETSERTFPVSITAQIVEIGIEIGDGVACEIIERGKGNCYWSQLATVGYRAKLDGNVAYATFETKDGSRFNSTIESESWSEMELVGWEPLGEVIAATLAEVY